MLKTIIMLIAALVTLGLAPTTSVANAQTIRFGGTIAEVRESSILFRTDRGPVEVLVTPDTRLVRNGQPARLSEFQHGDRAHVLAERTNRGLVGIAIEARSATIQVRGVIARVGDHAILLHTDRGDLHVAVTEHTIIVRNGERVRLGALQPGDRAGVDGVPDGEGGLIANSIHARSMGDIIELQGVIAEIGRGFIVVHNDRGNIQVWVTDRTRISRNGEPARLADLQLRDQVHVAAQWRGEGQDRRLVADRIAARGH